MKSFKNIYGSTITVHTKEMKDGQILKVNEISQEIKNLVRCGYLKEVSISKLTPSQQNPTLGTLK